MIHWVKDKDILKSDAQLIIIPVNTVGVMGRGLAKQFRDKYPEHYWKYKRDCKNGIMTYEKFYPWLSPNPDSYSFTGFLGFPTKKHWRNKSDIKHIEEMLNKLVDLLKNLAIIDIAIPAIGCGLGELDWEEVKPLITKAAVSSNTDFYIYEPR